MQKYANLVELENVVERIFFTKFRFDTAENEPAKKMQKRRRGADCRIRVGMRRCEAARTAAAIGDPVQLLIKADPPQPSPSLCFFACRVGLSGKEHGQN